MTWPQIIVLATVILIAGATVANAIDRLLAQLSEIRGTLSNVEDVVREISLTAQ